MFNADLRSTLRNLTIFHNTIQSIPPSYFFFSFAICSGDVHVHELDPVRIQQNVNDRRDYIGIVRGGRCDSELYSLLGRAIPRHAHDQSVPQIRHRDL